VSLVEPAWITFLSHEKLCQNAVLLTFIWPLLEAVSKALVKVSAVEIIDSLLVFLFCAVSVMSVLLGS